MKLTAHRPSLPGLRLGAIACGLGLLLLAGTCVGSGPQESGYVLKGTIVTPNAVIENGSVFIAGERIQAVGAGVKAPPEAKVIETSGVILPGFVDLHNHLTWNLFPRWKPTQQFNNRYDWQQLPIYGVLLATPHAELFKENLGCDMNRFAEVKAITEGETSVVGSLGPPQECIEGLARNLDFYSGLYQPAVLGGEKLRYEVFPLELDAAVAAQINAALDKKELTAFIVHLAEGKSTDASAAREFRMFTARGFLRPGVSIIHGVALKQRDFHEMSGKVGLIWSPRSNLELYGSTTDIAAALQEHLTVALSPDWSPTGSDGMLKELTFAAAWSHAQAPPVVGSAELVRMATEYPARLAGLGDRIGRLEAGYSADVLVLRRVEKDAYEAILHATPADVELVMVGGEPVYGDAAVMKKVLPAGQLETIPICGATKAISFGSEARLQHSAPKPWKDTVNALSAALEKQGTSLAPLAECAP